MNGFQCLEDGAEVRMSEVSDGPQSGEEGTLLDLLKLALAHVLRPQVKDTIAKKWNKRSSNQSIGYFWELINRAKLTAPPAREILMANQVSNQPRWPEVKANMALQTQSARLKFFNKFRQLGNVVLNVNYSAFWVMTNWAAVIVRFLDLSRGRYLTKKLRQSTALTISVLVKVKSPTIPTEHVMMN